MMVGRRIVRENVPADITETPGQYWMNAMYLVFIDHLLQEMDTRMLVAKIHTWHSYFVISPVIRCSDLLELNTIQYNTIQYNTIQYNSTL